MNLTAAVHMTRVWLADLPYRFKKLPASAEINVPYYSQFMSANLAEDYIQGRTSLRADPNWRQSGADNPEEYERWAWNDCGIACLKMVLAARDERMNSVGMVNLAKEAEKYSVFKVQGENVSPLHYAEFCVFVREKYGLNACPISALSVRRIKEELSKGNFVITSVHPNIRNPDSIPPKRGGHLVLAVGYDDERGGFYIHNPSGYQSNSSQNRAFISYDKFRKFFAYRGVVIQRPH